MSFRNLVELHRTQVERLGPKPALRHRVNGLYRDTSWTEYGDVVQACAAALAAAGVQPGDRVGLLAENRPEWLFADMGIMTAGAVNVPCHAGIPAQAVARLLADAGATWLFVSTAGQLAKAREVRKELPGVKGVVVFDRAAAAGDAPSWAAFLQQGRRALPSLAAELDRRERALTGDDLATIMYTSGTTGVPKGVMLTHGNLLANAEQVLDLVQKDYDIVLLNWLPFSHIFARLCDHYLSIRAGVLMALSESVDALPADILEVQPTHIHGVPRFWEKMLAAARAYPDPAKVLRAMFGRRVQWLMSGGAPLPPEVCKAYQAAGLPLVQGYGLTETAPVLTNNRPDDFRVESAGKAIPGVELKIADDGEILARGPNVMRGYWKQPQATAEVIRDGWFYTGDMGHIDSDGFLYITGRKKDLIVLSSGKKVTPSGVENLLLSEPHLEQAIVFGDHRNFLTAVLVPNWAKVRQTLSLNGSDEELAKNPAVDAFFQERVAEVLKSTAAWEQVKKFVIRPKPFGIETGEMTVSLKLKRDTIRARHAAELDRLYAE